MVPVEAAPDGGDEGLWAVDVFVATRTTTHDWRSFFFSNRGLKINHQLNNWAAMANDAQANIAAHSSQEVKPYGPPWSLS